MAEILAMATVLTGVTTGVVQAFKKATNINHRYLPLMALVLGVGLGAGAYFLDAEIGLRMWAGGVSGLASVGLFEGLKSTQKDDE